MEAIIQAAAQLLTDIGFEGLTTARVAERAGVSVGSLYQYFPNKQGLAAALVDHHAEKFSAAFSQTVEASGHGTLAETVEAMIEVAMAAHPQDPKLYRALNELAPRYRAEKVQEVGSRIAAIIKEQLARHRHEIAPDLDLGDAAALIEILLENVIHRAIERHPVSVSGERAMDQCRRMIMAYLTSGQRHAA